MSFKIYQLEKSQAMDLLDRVAEQMLQKEFYGEWDVDTVSEASDDVMALYRKIEAMSTELRGKQAMDFEDIMVLANNADEYVKRARGTFAEYMATHLSNYNVSKEACLLAAGYALPERDKLCYQEVGGDEVNWMEEEGRL